MTEEEDWIDRARRGDREAFAALVDRYLPPIRRFLVRLGACEPELDDLTQEVFLTMLSSLPEFRAESKMSTWLFGVAVRVARRQVAREAYRPMDGLEGEPHVAAAAEADPSELRELSDRVRAGVGRLSPALREAFVLRHLEERSVAEAARILDVPEGTVRRRAHEAREQIRRLLIDEEARR